MSFTKEKSKIIKALRKITDPELGINIVDLGLIYNIIITKSDFNENFDVIIEMTLTTPGCPLSDYFVSEVETVLLEFEFLNDVKVNFVWDPAWDISMIDENAKLEMFNKMRNMSKDT